MKKNEICSHLYPPVNMSSVLKRDNYATTKKDRSKFFSGIFSREECFFSSPMSGMKIMFLHCINLFQNMFDL